MRLLALVLLLVPGVAWADPVSISAFLITVAVNAGAYGTALVLASYVVYETNRQQRKAREAARQAYNASLQDRQIMIRSAIAARPVIYGRAMVSGPIVFVHTSGTRNEFLHLVVALAGHQCDAVEQVYFNDVALPAPDGAGFIQSGPFFRLDTIAEVFTNTGTSLNTGQTIAAVQSVTRTRGSGDNVESTVLALTSGYTFSGTTVTIVDGLNQAGDSYAVNYTRTQAVPRVRVRTFLGGAGQVASSELIAESGGRWTSAHIGAGICYLYVRLEYDQDIFGQVGVPNIKALVRGKRVFDPRSTTTAWSDNAALCTRDYLLDTVLGLGASAGEVPDAEINAAANICDEEVILHTTGTVSVTNGNATVTGSGTTWLTRARPGMLFRGPDGVTRTILSVASNTSLTLTANYTGSTTSGAAYSLRQRRYTTNGVLSTDASARDNLEDLVGSMAGSAVWVQGRWLVRAGAGRSAEFTLTEDFLADGDIAIQARAPRSQLFNAVSGTFIDPASLYSETSYPSVENATYVSQDAGQRIAREASWPLVNDATACQRLAKIMLERSRQALTIQLSTNLRGYDLVPSDWVALTISRYGWSGKLFEVIQRSWQPGGAIRYTLRETAAAVYDWALGDQTTVDLATNTNLPNPFTLPAILTGLTVTSGTAALTQPFVGRVQVSWTLSTDAFVVQGGRIEVQWKLDDATVWTSEPPVIGSGTSTSFGPVDRRRVLLVRARAVNSYDRAGPWAYALHVVSGRTAVGGGNLVRNSGFDVDSDSNGLCDNWTSAFNGTTGTITNSRQATAGLRGGSAQRVSASNLGTTSSDFVGLFQDVNVAGFSQQAWQLGWSVKGIAGSGFRFLVFVEFRDSSNVLVSTTTGVEVDSSPDWIRLRLSATVPATAVSARCVLVGRRQNTAGVATFDSDDVQFEIADVATAWAPRADELLPGVVGTTELAAQAATVLLSTSDDVDRTLGRTTDYHSDLTLTFTPSTADPIVISAMIDAAIQGGWSVDFSNFAFIVIAPSASWSFSSPWYSVPVASATVVAVWDRNPTPGVANMSGTFTPAAGTAYRLGVGAIQSIIGNNMTVYNRTLRLEHIKR